MMRYHLAVVVHVVASSCCLALLLGCCGKRAQAKDAPAKPAQVEKAPAKPAQVEKAPAKPAQAQQSRDWPANCAAFDQCVLDCSNGAKLEKDAAAKRVACKKDGKIEGDELVWHANGKKKLFSTWIDGKKEGRVVTWYDNGQKHLDGEKRNGMADGAWRSWHEDGKKASESVWSADKRVSGQCWDRKGVACEEARCLKEVDCQ